MLSFHIFYQTLFYMTIVVYGTTWRLCQWAWLPMWFGAISSNRRALPHSSPVSRCQACLTRPLVP